jgi:hypothetical protein
MKRNEVSLSNLNQKEQLAILYFQTTDVWKRLCEEHMELFNITMDEYTLLLNSEIEQLEYKIREKEAVIATIKGLEKVRQEIIVELDKFFDEKIDSVSKLLEVMTKFEVEKKEKHLFRFNALLIDMIEKIQAQNKKNQLFINKALRSLKDIRMEALGEKNYQTYTSKGSTKSSLAR